jgi:hypothetical protein
MVHRIGVVRENKRYFATVRMLMYLKRMTPKHCFQTIFSQKSLDRHNKGSKS